MDAATLTSPKAESAHDAFRLDGKTILICGASGGLGQALAHDAAALGAHLILCARSSERLMQLAASLPGTAHDVKVADLTQQEDRERLSQTCPPLDGLLYAAGHLGRLAPFAQISADDLNADYQTHAVAPLMLTQALLRKRLLRRGASLVFLTSTNATANTVATAPYSAAKAALIAGLRSMASEVARKGIRVNTVAHGYVNTQAPGATWRLARLHWPTSIWFA